MSPHVIGTTNESPVIALVSAHIILALVLAWQLWGVPWRELWIIRRWLRYYGCVQTGPGMHVASFMERLHVPPPLWGTTASELTSWRQKRVFL